MNVPNLRFKEFTDEWQYIKLQKFISIYKEQSTIENQYPMLTSSKQGLIFQKDYYSNDARITNRSNIGYNILPYGYITYRNRSDTGFFTFNINLKLKKALVSYFYPVFSLKNSNEYFLVNLLNTKYKFKIYAISEGTSQKVLSITDLKNLKILCPNLKEQQKIADFLSTVDKKIENLNTIIENLEQQKKGLMQQIFNQKLRFKDEKGNNYPNWEEKLFSDTFSFLSTNNYSRTDMNEQYGIVKNIHYGDVLIKFNHIIDLSKHQLPYLPNYNSIPKDILKKKLEKQLIKNGDIVIADTAEDYTAGKVCEIININDNLVVSGLHTMLCRPKPNLFVLGFLGYFMNSYTYHHQLLRLITGTKVCSIIKKEIVKTKILIPCLEEQQKIADFLSAFDRKIDNHKAQLEHWQQIKKGLLQQMFV